MSILPTPRVVSNESNEVGPANDLGTNCGGRRNGGSRTEQKGGGREVDKTAPTWHGMVDPIYRVFESLRTTLRWPVDPDGLVLLNKVLLVTLT